MTATPVLGALDVGNRRVLALIAELDERRELVIRGVGVSPSAGLRHGQVVQLKPVVAAIRAAVEEAELMAKVPVSRVLASVAGTFIVGKTTRTAVVLGSREREVRRRDLEDLVEAARRQPSPPGHSVLNVLTHTYSLDDQDGLLDPQDMVGRHLSMDAYVLICQDGPLRTLEKAINTAGIEVEEFLFSPVAAALATLTEDERRLGAVVLDVGHGCTGFAAVAGNQVLAAGSFSVGSAKINDDLIHRFQTTWEGAEKAKCEVASCLYTEVDEEETLSLPSMHGRGTQVVSRRELCKVVYLRAHEMVEYVANEILQQVPDGTSLRSVVLCGGGAHLDGLIAVAENVFAARARLAELDGVADATHLLASSELPPASPAVAVGLLAHARRAALPDAPPLVRPRPTRAGWLQRLAARFSHSQGGGS
jgi:cell division protein FtsA